LAAPANSIKVADRLKYLFSFEENINTSHLGIDAISFEDTNQGILSFFENSP